MSIAGSVLLSLFASPAKPKAAPRLKSVDAGLKPAVAQAPAPAAPRPPEQPAAIAVERRNWLLGIGGGVEGKSWFLGERTTTIGRSAQNPVQVVLPEVSRVHCQVRADGESLRVHDMKSRAGILVNGERVKSAVLRPGDELNVGGARFVFQPAGTHEDAMRLWKQSNVGTECSTQIGPAAAKPAPAPALAAVPAEEPAGDR